MNARTAYPADGCSKRNQRRRPNRVQGHPGGGCKGGTPPCPPEAWPVGTIKTLCVQARTPCRMPPHRPAGIAEPVASCEGVLHAGPTKGTSVVFHGSS